MTGRGKHAGVGGILQGGGSGESSICVGYMGDDPPIWAGPWGFSRTGWLIISQKDSCSGFGTEVGSTLIFGENIYTYVLFSCVRTFYNPNLKCT